MLRGEKSRFQLFGDTLDLASKMESSGSRNKIQLSQDTAELLVQSGKSHWLRPRRQDLDGAASITSALTPTGDFSVTSGYETGAAPAFKIVHNGKPITTFWLEIDQAVGTKRRRASAHVRERRAASVSEPLEPLRPRSLASMSLASMSRDSNTSYDGIVDELADWGEAQIVEPGNPIKTAAERQQLERLIDWNVEELLSILRRVVARRNAIKIAKRKRRVSITFDSTAHGTSMPPESPMKKARDRMRISFDNSGSRRESTSSVDSKGLKPKSGRRNSTSFSSLPMNEIQEVVPLAEFDPSLPGLKATDAAVKLGSDVQQELRDFVSQIAAGYSLDNSFHNFEHASHVCLSSNKLLKRILQSDAVERFGAQNV